MIIQEILEENTDLIKTYSDMGMMVIQDETGDMYGEAIDPVWTHRTYTESDVPIDPEDEPVE